MKNSIEFCVYPTCFRGIKIGRLYLNSLALKMEISQTIYPYMVVKTKEYSDDQIVVWFLSSLEEYRRLAELYPQRNECLRKKTQELLGRMESF